MPFEWMSQCPNCWTDINFLWETHGHYFISVLLLTILCAYMIPAHRERKPITRRKKETLGKEKVGKSGESKNQSTSNVFYVLYAIRFV